MQNPFEDLLGLNQIPSVKTVISYKKFDSCFEVPDKLFIPSVQRNIIQEHLGFMRKYIQDCAKTGEEPIFGTIDLALYKDTYFLVDGQHRFLAIQKEFFENKTIVPIHAAIYEIQVNSIGIDEVKAETLAKAKVAEIFKLRNQGIPVPSFILSSKEEKKDLLKDISTFLELLCPDIFRQIGGHTRPKININSFLEIFRKTEKFKTVKTLEDFRKIFNDLNVECYHKVYRMTEKQMKKYGITENMLSVWAQNKIFIGYSKDFDFLVPEKE